jgi:hypothetical protein
MKDVPARRLVDPNALPKEPGEYKIVGEDFTHHKARLMFACPCGCGDILGALLGPEERKVPPVWKWDGNLDKPTVTPSIEFLAGCRWHGHLTEGVFKTDSGGLWK